MPSLDLAGIWGEIGFWFMDVSSLGGPAFVRGFFFGIAATVASDLRFQIAL